MRPYYYLGNLRGLTELSTGQVFIVNTEARDIATWIISTGVWETFVDNVMSALAQPGGVFLDVGANMGYYSIKIGGIVGPTGKVFSFEPNPDLFEVLSDNIHINGYTSRARYFNAAAGDAPGVSTLLFERRYPGGGQVGLGAEYEGPQHTRVDVQVLRIDDVVPEDVSADLIKIDVEGFEPLVLRGMKALLARSPNAAIVTEVSYPAWEKFGDPAALLRDVCGDRTLFSIHADGWVEELDHDIDRVLNRDFVSYILMLPPGEDFRARIASFTTPAPPPGAAEAVEAPAEAEPEPQPAPVRYSLARRAAGKMMRMAFPDQP